VSESVAVNGDKKEELHGDKETELSGGHTKKFRGIPVNVKLFEVFWEQVVELIKVCPVESSLITHLHVI
jgi:vacuolar protein sorting-associated protein 35